jgi:hypothetical protein
MYACGYLRSRPFLLWSNHCSWHIQYITLPASSLQRLHKPAKLPLLAERTVSWRRRKISCISSPHLVRSDRFPSSLARHRLRPRREACHPPFFCEQSHSKLHCWSRQFLQLLA